MKRESSMEKETFQLIKNLTELQGISGDEGRVRDYLRRAMVPLVDELHQSPLGNIFGVKKSNIDHAPRLMIASHMDEVGFMVAQITDNGMLRVQPIGGWNTYAISAQRYTLQTKKGDYVCVSSAVAPHLLRGKEGGNQLKASDILFDAGFMSKEEAIEYGVRPGDSIVPQTETILTANGKNMIGKAWDNRYGCAVMLETLKAVQGYELSSTLIAGASVQEEVGLRGIKGAVHEFQPDLFLAVDCSPANDQDGVSDKQGILGQGFLLRMQDPGHITHKGLRDYLLDMAETHKIPYQYYFSQGGTDAGAAHTMNAGIPSGVIGVPGRYIHGHQTLFNIEDYEAAREMLVLITKTFDRTTFETIKSNG